MTLKYRTHQIPKAYDVREVLCEGLNTHGIKVRTFESLAQVKHELDLRAHILRKHGCNELADKLSACRKCDRCGSMACPICSRIRRINTFRSVFEFVVKYDAAELSFVTLINPDEAFPAKDFASYEPERLMQRIRKQLDRLGVLSAKCFILAYFDCEWDAGWELFQPHIHLIAYMVPRSVWTSLAQRHFGKCKRVRVRTRVEPISSLARTVNYLDKLYWLEQVRKQNCLGLKPRRPKRIHSLLAHQVYRWMDIQIPSNLRFCLGAKSFRRRIVK